MDLTWLYSKRVIHQNKWEQINPIKKLPGRKPHDIDKAIKRKEANEQAVLKRENDAKKQSQLLRYKIRLTNDVDSFSVYGEDTFVEHIVLKSSKAHRKHNLPIQKKNERITRHMLTKNGKGLTK